LNEAEVKARAFAMPLTSPAFPPSDVPVLAVLSGAHIPTDLTLGLGTVAVDYLG
jgi:acetoacetate decarboxylase